MPGLFTANPVAAPAASNRIDVVAPLFEGDARRFEFSPPVALHRAAVGNERHEAARGTEQRSADTAFSGAEDDKGAWGGVHRISAA